MLVEDILKEFGVKYTLEPEYYKVLCPFHDDTNPSGRIHQKRGMFNCFTCSKRTNLEGYLAKFSNLPVYQVKVKIGYKSDCKQPIAPTEVEQYHIAIWEHPTFLKELYHRQIFNDDIRKYRLGVKDLVTEKRISIPIPNDIGEYANLRLYIPGAKDRKFLNLIGKDRSKVRLFPIEQLEYDSILICGGELKAVAAARVLNQYDIGAIAPTCGENEWPAQYNERFAGKLVYVNCDVDKTGERFAEIRCRTLKPVAREVHKITFTPEQVGHLEKGDLNDFIRLGGNLYQLLIDTPEWVLIPGGEFIEEPASEVSFKDAYSQENVGKKLKFTGIVASINSSTYLAPAVVQVKCNRNEEFCTLCDVNSQAITDREAVTLHTEMNIGKEHPSLLALIGEKTEDHWKIYKTCFKIPAKCRQCLFQVQKSYSITEVRLDEQVDPISRLEPLTMRSAYIINSQHSVDQQSYILTGRLYPSPKNQIATFLVSDLEPTADALDSYSPVDVQHLDRFVPDEWTCDSIQKKLDEIYYDFECNVTKIYQRRDYHLAIDLVYHSVLNFQLNDTTMINGWVEILIIGDTEQGKSEVSRLLNAHYGLGQKIDCKNISLPGLTIALEKSPSKHFAIYGALPRNDRRMLIFEELKGMHPKIYQALTEVRSSGLVQITKIDSKTRRARVRILAISNPMDKRSISSYTYGIESAVGVIGTNEDLRRFDAVMILGAADIDVGMLSKIQETPPTTEHRFLADLCQKLVLKAWKCEKVEFEDTTCIIESTRRLVAKFGDGLPILGPNGSHIKIAKLSAALAARTFSYNDETLIVRRCHIEYIEKFLFRIYSSQSSRLDDKSKSIRDSTLLRDKIGLISYLKSITNSADIVIKLIETDEISGKFIQELCGDFYVGSTLLSRLIQSNAVIKIRADRYAKTTEFTTLLANTQFELSKPDYIKKEREKF